MIFSKKNLGALMNILTATNSTWASPNNKNWWFCKYMSSYVCRIFSNRKWWCGSEKYGIPCESGPNLLSRFMVCCSEMNKITFLNATVKLSHWKKAPLLRSAVALKNLTLFISEQRTTKCHSKSGPFLCGIPYFSLPHHHSRFENVLHT